jgi:hypothetical protein
MNYKAFILIGALGLVGCGSVAVVNPPLTSHMVAVDKGDPERLRPVATPTPVPTSTPTAAPARAQANPPASSNRAVSVAQAAPTRLMLVGPGLHMPIMGSVGNCAASVRTVPYSGAYYDACQPGLWLLCHVAVCPSMNSWGIGSQVTYYDGNGNANYYTISNVQVVLASYRGGFSGSVHFQVCADAAGTYIRIMTA